MKHIYYLKGAWLLLATMLCLPLAGVAQVECTSGTPTIYANGDSSSFTTQNFPGYGYYKYSYTEVIIPASQLEGAGDIMALQFCPTSANTNGSHYTNCNIYLAHTSQTSLQSSFIQDPNSFELVFSGDLAYTAGQWRTVEFDEPFTYDGESNLVVAIQRNHGTSYGSNGRTFVAYNAGTNNYLARSVQNDNTAYILGSITGGSTTYTVPVYRLVSCPAVPDACARVTDLTVTGVTDTEATLAWSDDAASNEGATYTIYNGSEVVADGITDLFYNLTNLEPITTYTFTVVATCEGGDLSRGRSITFTTTCGAVSVPYTQNFDALATNGLPDCWTHVTPGSNSSNFVGAVNGPVHGTGGMCLRFYYSSADGNVVALPPTAAPLNTLQLRFWARPESITNPSCGTLYTGYVTNLGDASTFVAVDSVRYDQFAAAEYEEFEVLLSSAPAGAMAAFCNKATGSNWYMHVDDVVLEPIPACVKVSNLQVSAINPEGATLTWEDNHNSDATYNIWNGDTPLDLGIVGTEVTLVGLQPNTYYNLAVQVNCLEDDTSRRVEVGFRTSCADRQPLPYTEDFEGLANLGYPPCWTRALWYVNNSVTYPNIYNSFPRTGSNSLYMYYQSGYGSTTSAQIAAGPVMEGAGNNLHVKFWARFSANAATDVMEAGVVNEAGEASSFVPLLRVAADQVTRQVYAQYEFYTDNLPTDDPVRVAFRWTSNNNNNLCVDDLLIEAAPTCRMPIGPVVRDITYEGATLQWTDYSTSPHAVRYGTVGNVTAASAPIMVEEGNSVTLDGLQSNTTYYAWVATVCDGDTLDWVPFGSFTTDRDCYPVVNPVVSSVSLTSAVLNWQFDTQHGREATGVTITLTDAASPQNPRTIEVEGTAAMITGLEPSHTYLAVLTTACSDYASSATSVAIATPSCGKADGGGSWQFGPFNGNYNYGYSQTLYPAEVVGAIEEITGLKFSLYNSANTNPTRTVDIYMANTSLSDLDTNAYLPITDFTLVAENATLNVGSSGWKTINFSTSFFNQRGQNIVVAVVNKTGNSRSFMWNCHEADYGAMVCWNTDAAAINLANPMSAATAPSRGRHTRVADIEFVGECDLTGCRAPVAGLVAATESELALGWIAEGGEEAWVVEYRHASDEEWSPYDDAYDTEMTIDGLEPATHYLMRVGALCNDDTLYSNIVSAYTSCADLEYPYTESFEEWSAMAFPACWQRPITLSTGSGSNAATYPRVAVGETYAHSGNAGIEMRATSNNTTLIVSPQVMLPANMIHIEFWTKLAQYNNTVTLQVGLMSDPADATTFVPVETFNPTNYQEWAMYECYTDAVSYEGEEVYVAFRYISSSNTGFNVYIDDITIGEDLACRRPQTGGIDRYTYSDVTLHWAVPANVPDGYQILLTHSYTTDDSEAIYSEANDATATVGGLDFGTEYHAWVASVCDGAPSDYLYLGSFVTDERCMPVVGLQTSSVDATAAVLAWEYDTIRGVDATGAIVKVVALDDPESDTLTLQATGLGTIVSPLMPGTTYKAWVTTQCDADRARTAPAVVFTTHTCAMEYTDAVNKTTQIPLRENSARHSYAQMLYPPTMLNGMDSVRGLAFKVVEGGESHSNPYVFDIYVGSTSLSGLGRYTYVPTARMLKVATQYTLDIDRNGWFVIPFDTVFAPNADSNLVVTVVNNGGFAHADYLCWNYHASTSYSTLHYYNNTADVLNPDSLAGSYSTFNYTPDLMLIGDCQYSCTAPSVVVENATQQSITLRWTASEEENEWVVGYNTGDSIWHDTLATQNPYTIEGLNASSYYNIRVGKLCYADEESTPDTLFATLGAYTQCGVTSVPFTPVFTAALGPCWSVSHPASVYAETSSSSLYLASPYYYAILPEIDQDLADVQLKMNFKLTNTSYSLMIGATADGGEHIEWVDTLHVATAHVPVETVTYFLNYSGEGRRIVIANGSGSYYTRIDAVAVEPRDVCFPADSLKAKPGVGSVYLSWAGPEEATYVVEYSTADDASWQVQETDSTHLMIRGLQHSSHYTARVRVVCAEGDSSRWTEVEFITPCDAVPMPLHEDFESLAGNGSFTYLLPCWNFYEAPYDEVMAGTADLQPMSNYRWSSAPNGTIDGYGMRLNIYGDISHVHHWAVTPALAVDEDEPLVAFDYSVSFYNSSTTAADPDDRFMVLATRDGGRSWEPLAMWGSDPDRDTFQLTTAYNTPIHVELPLQRYFGDTLRIAFYGQSTVPGADIYVNIDNLHIGHRECPSIAPDSLVATTSSVTLHHDASADCEVAIVEGEWNESAAGTATQQGSYTFAGLNPATTYSVGVRRLCTDGYHSRWTVSTVATLDNQGISTADGTAALGLAPNPASSQVVVSLDGMTAGAQVELLDMAGRQLGRWTMTDGQAVIDLRGVPQGTYFVRVASAEVHAVGKLVVK